MSSTVAALVVHVPAQSAVGAQVLVLVMAIGLCTYASCRGQEGGDILSGSTSPPRPLLGRSAADQRLISDHHRVPAQDYHGCRQKAIRVRKPNSQSTNLLLDTPYEVAVAIACQLDSATDLLRLGMACKRFWTKPLTNFKPECGRLRSATVPSLGGELHPASPTGPSSAIHEAARCWLMGRSQEQQAWVPYRPRGSVHLSALERVAMQRIKGIIAAFLQSLHFLNSEFEDAGRHEALLQRNMAVRTAAGVQPHPGRFVTLLRAVVSQLEPHIACLQACGMLADFAGGLFHVSSFKLSLFVLNLLALDRTLKPTGAVIWQIGWVADTNTPEPDRLHPPKLDEVLNFFIAANSACESKLIVQDNSQSSEGATPEASTLAYGECWLARMHELMRLCAPLALTWTHGSVEVSADRCEVIKTGDEVWRCAACDTQMRAGRHFVKFTLLRGTQFVIGVIRPDWKGLEGSPTWTYSAGWHSVVRTWDVPNGPAEEGDQIGVLLDLELGTMEAWIRRNTSTWDRLDIAGTSLKGEYSWAVLIRDEGDTVRIEHMPESETSKLSQIFAI